MDIKRAETIEYRPSIMADSEYKVTRLVQNTGANNVIISTSESVATIELPAVAMNLAKSYLNFTITVPANSVADHYAVAYRDTPPIQRLELFTRGGKYLCDISNFANIYQAFGQRTKRVEDYHGFSDGAVVKTAINDLTTKRFQIGGNGTVAAPAVVNFKISGAELYNTILSLDKSVYFGEVLQLRITFGAKDSIGYWQDDLAVNQVTAGGAITLTNLNYFLAQEQNPRVVNDLVQTVSTEGMSLVVPFVHSYKTSATAVDTAVSIRLSRGHGQSVERIYTIPINGDESFGTRYIADAEQLVSFYSLLDSRRLQEFDVLCGNATTGVKDYLWLRAHEKKERVVSLDAANDEKNFAWSDSWCDGLECAVQQHLGGLDLSVERKYDVYFKSLVATTKYYTAVVCQKMLTMGPNGVDIM
jgi:hypothetical protein